MLYISTRYQNLLTQIRLKVRYVLCNFLSIFPYRSLRKTEWGGCWSYLRRSFIRGAIPRFTTRRPTPTCRPSSPTRTSCTLPLTCTQAWLEEPEIWTPSTSPSTIRHTRPSTQSRVSLHTTRTRTHTHTHTLLPHQEWGLHAAPLLTLQGKNEEFICKNR